MRRFSEKLLFAALSACGGALAFAWYKERNAITADSFSELVRNAITYSQKEAIRLGHGRVETRHLLLGITRERKSKAASILRELGCDLRQLRRAIEAVSEGAALRAPDAENIPLMRSAERILKEARREASKRSSHVVGTEHLLLSLLRDDENLAAKVLQQKGKVSYGDVRAKL